MVREREVRVVPGVPALLIGLLVFLGSISLFIVSVSNEMPAPAVLLGVLWAVNLLLLFGLFIVNPNEAKVLQLFGRYVGTVRDAGLKWSNPFYTKRKISARVRNFESNKLKVNEQDGSPIEIAAVVVWRVVDTAEAAFEVDNYENFVHVQSESALRNLATQHPYDAHDDTTKLSLRGNTAAVAEQLKAEIQERLAKAGVEVIEARISHLAYAPEIAAVMLRRQQANAIIEMALDMLQRKNVVALDEERKAAMVSNLLVVLCGEHDTTPVINTGTIYH
jgi:regulator of protease activity HflC (stomatin/prohibitin superfamily)